MKEIHNIELPYSYQFKRREGWRQTSWPSLNRLMPLLALLVLLGGSGCLGQLSLDFQKPREVGKWRIACYSGD